MSASLTLELSNYQIRESKIQSPVAPAVVPLRAELVSHELLSRIAQGEQEALAALFDRTSRIVFGLAHRILRNEAEAEEAMLDVFLYVWRRARDFDTNRGNPTSWLLMVARSRVIDRVRSNKLRREREDPLDEFQFFAEGCNPEEHSIAGQIGGRVRRALEQLPWEQRQALELAYFQGLSQSEIARQLETPLGTIKTRVRQGILRLRHRMGEALVAG